ncbi:hypothetical protein BDF21DRAFT_468825 [Thamnidium elegans]|nr:hypothetical protein BDF21DRAFT_468825 [Thamnidium elegans]
MGYNTLKFTSERAEHFIGLVRTPMKPYLPANIQLSPDVDLCYKLYKSKEVLEQVQVQAEEAVNSDKKEDLILENDSQLLNSLVIFTDRQRKIFLIRAISQLLYLIKTFFQPFGTSQSNLTKKAL